MNHNRWFALVWVFLLGLTAVEVFLSYTQVFSTAGMLVILMALSLVKAGLIMAYFMHLRSERVSFVLALVPGVVMVIGLLFVFFPDSVRLFDLGVMQ